MSSLHSIPELGDLFHHKCKPFCFCHGQQHHLGKETGDHTYIMLTSQVWLLSTTYTACNRLSWPAYMAASKRINLSLVSTGEHKQSMFIFIMNNNAVTIAYETAHVEQKNLDQRSH